MPQTGEGVVAGLLYPIHWFLQQNLSMHLGMWLLEEEDVVSQEASWQWTGVMAVRWALWHA